MIQSKRNTAGWKLGIVGVLGVYAIAPASDRAFTQSITLDGTLGSAGTLNGPTYVIPQASGQTVGSNLFHSFGQFDLNTGERAIFNSAANISNILSRVTGGQTPFINGQIFTRSARVNLFLINPSSIIFGPNASLDIGGTTRGSFVATTVDAISWSNGGQFSATNPGGASSLLTLVGDPRGFISSLTPPEPIFGLGTLSVYPSQSLLLLGGDVGLSNAILTAPGGRIEIGGVNGAGTVDLNSDFSLSFPNELTNKFTVTGRGGLPPNPDNPLTNDALQTDWATLEATENNAPPNSANQQPPAAIVEAQGWIVDPQGRVVLLARSPQVTPNSSKLTSSCNGL